MAYFDPKVAYFDPKVAYFDPRVAYFDPRVAYFDPRVAYFDLLLLESHQAHRGSCRDRESCHRPLINNDKR